MKPQPQLDTKIVELAKLSSSIEKNYHTDYQERLRAVSFSYLDIIDYAVENNIISHESDRLPRELDSILINVYNFLGEGLDDIE